MLSCLLVLFTAACSEMGWLDIRDEPVSERIRRHEGSAWRDIPTEAANQESLVFAAQKSPALNRDGKKGGGLCRKLGDSSDNAPPFPQTTVQAKAAYFAGPDFYLSSGKIWLNGKPDPLDLILTNEGLNCRPPGRFWKARWVCKQWGNIPPPYGSDPVLLKCVGDAPNTALDVVNLIGVIDDRFCLYVSLAEQKPRGHEEKNWPTRISNDKLLLTLTCAALGDDAGPKSIVGGPKPNFIAPVKLISGE